MIWRDYLNCKLGVGFERIYGVVIFFEESIKIKSREYCSYFIYIYDLRLKYLFLVGLVVGFYGDVGCWVSNYIFLDWSVYGIGGSSIGDFYSRILWCLFFRRYGGSGRIIVNYFCR